MDGVQALLFLLNQLIGYTVKSSSHGHLVTLMWCSLAANLLVVTRGRTKGLTLRSYGDGVYGGMPMPLRSIEV